MAHALRERGMTRCREEMGHALGCPCRLRCGRPACRKRLRAGDRADPCNPHRRDRGGAADRRRHRDRERPHPRHRSIADAPGARRRHDRRPHRQIRGARDHQRPRPCRPGPARGATAPICALRRHHHDQHVVRPGRYRRVQGQAEGGRSARSAHPQREVSLHVAALHPGLGVENAGRGPRPGRRHRRQGRRLRQSLDRQPGRQAAEADARHLCRGDGSGPQTRQAHDGPRRRTCRREGNRGRGRESSCPQCSRPGDSR